MVPALLGVPFLGGWFSQFGSSTMCNVDHLKALLLQFSLIMDVAAISTRIGVGLEDFPRWRDGGHVPHMHLPEN